ncbi:MAG: tRNA preQ1(34) S-adenosylmethionine ribosyltransferase-isomerase QueA [Bacteroidota bacterium]|jgi:S-adenosylmethionine:tRNA ribosyltransferase-isomerase|nr:tRNA preQ1(34) S-adenosylmethionine ribosyltransferase-isomerase QueA [Bacteroidota bacterium]GDX48123.1 S-adenosylmethionine:tRNA ribosyltransferase-isomerase [Bacteroidota bacterium]
MKLTQFRFDVPNSLLAQRPTPNRDDARLMIIDRKTGKFKHKKFREVLSIFDDGDSMILNNTRVFPARMYGRKEKTGAKIEVFLLRELNHEMRLWDVLVDPARKIRVGNKLYFGDDGVLVAEVVDNTTSRGRTIRFLFDGTDDELKETLYNMGETPIPKYIKRKPDDEDRDRYQTVYAKVEGAVAAPTAGMHFTREMLKRLEIKGVNIAELTLHIGLGTFRQIEVEDLSKHKMDAEYFNLSRETCDVINTSIDKKKNVISVGTTVMRALETSVTAQGYVKPMEGWTNLFIHPPHDFSIANMLLTNFHLPKTSLYIMACAFGGYDLMVEAYKVAIKEKYRFATYGDAMLIL